MKIARFATGDEIRYGIVEGLPKDLPTPTGECDAHLIVLKGDPLYTLPEATGEVINLSEVRLLSPVIPRSKVVGVADNYTVPGQRADDGAPQPELFLKPNTAVIGPDVPIVLPAWSGQVRYGAQLAVIIGCLSKDISPQKVSRAILGYTVAADVYAYDAQEQDANWTRAKSFDTSCPLGPWIEIPKPGATEGFNPDLAMISSRIDASVVQEDYIRHLRTPIAQLIAYASTIFTLLPGDVILTGSPAHAGEIRAGQRAEAAVEGIGAFSNPVVRR